MIRERFPNVIDLLKFDFTFDIALELDEQKVFFLKVAKIQLPGT